MALLGLFSKKDKHKSPNPSTTTKSSAASTADSASVVDTSEYVLPDLPDVSGQGNQVYGHQQAEASSSKFHLGFSRKRSTPAPEVAERNLLRPPPMPVTASSRSEAHLDQIRPPPSKASLFATYGDPQNALSTRSLPTQADARPRPSQEMGDPGGRTSAENPPVPPKKSGGIFSWAHRERKKSKPTEAPPKLDLNVSSDSFNLKSFRHVGPESPASDSTIPSPALLPPARPRPRGDSVASDSSQRISVAAFREMAARKSTVTIGPVTSSPVLLRPPSRSDSLENARLRGSPASFTRAPIPARSSTLAVSTDSTSEESEEGSEESDSDDSTGSATMRPRRQRTITKQHMGGKSISELGHRRVSPVKALPPPPPPKSVADHSSERTDHGPVVQRSKLNAAEKRAMPETTLPSSTPPAGRLQSKAVAHDSDTDDSSDSSSEDSDDAPLASLVRPPRPGSSASNATSGSRSRAPSKPLIDISQLNTPPVPVLSTASDRPFTPPQKHPLPPLPDKSAINEKINDIQVSRSDKPSLSDRLARVAQTAAGRSVETLASAAPLERRSLDLRPLLSETNERGRLPQPSRSQTAPMDNFDRTPSSSPSAVRSKLKPNGRSLSSPNAAAAYDLTDPTPIVPTLIRERSPPPSFSVTSRPSSQLSLNPNRLSNSQSTIRVVDSSSTSSSPTSPTFPLNSASAPPSSADSAASFAARTSFFSSTPAVPSGVSIPRVSATSSSSSSPVNRPSPTSRPRSSTLLQDASAPSTAGFTGGGLLATPAAIPLDPKAKALAAQAARTARQRSSTLLPRMDITPPSRESVTGNNSRPPMPTSSSSSSSQQQSQPQSTHRLPQRPRHPFDNSSSGAVSASQQAGVAPPRRPFAASERGYSPASSTGDSSSGRTPLTPADGSDLGYGDTRSVVSAAVPGGRKGHRRGAASVSFDDEPEKGRTPVKSGDADEERRKERRRSEAKAAIELGKVVNGQIRLDDDDDEDLPLNSMGSRLSLANPMLNFTPATPMAWQTSPSMPMMAPQSFITPPASSDPRFLVAHNHAMMVAKQAYQMAVAQQALAAANDEWERGSSTSAFSSMPMNMNPMGMGMPMGMPMGGMPMMSGGYGMNYPMFPSTASMYAGSVAGSEIGAGWGSRSEYGGPSARSSRTSAMFTDRQSMYGLNPSQRSGSHGRLAPPSSASDMRPSMRPRTKTAPSDSPLPPQHARARQAPPSSWKVSPGGR